MVRNIVNYYLNGKMSANEFPKKEKAKNDICVHQNAKLFHFLR